MTLVIFIISIVLATIIVNTAQQLFMKVLGMDMMFFSAKKKILIIIGVALILGQLVLNIFS